MGWKAFEFFSPTIRIRPIVFSGKFYISNFLWSPYLKHQEEIEQEIIESSSTTTLTALALARSPDIVYETSGLSTRLIPENRQEGFVARNRCHEILLLASSIHS